MIHLALISNVIGASFNFIPYYTEGFFVLLTISPVFLNIIQGSH